MSDAPDASSGGGQRDSSRVQRIAQLIALAGVAALLALLVWKVVVDDRGGAADALARGEHVAAPGFTLERLDASAAGEQISLADLHGKAVVVNFWASWCIPCKDEAPFLQKIYDQYRAKGLVVLGVDAQDFRKDARRFLARYGLKYPVAYDGKGSTLGKWGVTGFPETFFVDRSGQLVGERIAGGVDIKRNRDAFERGLTLALGNTP
jgi:cytochrome c biogenesis protein CcmG, thiol:disulfide interchange protein DsbE